MDHPLSWRERAARRQVAPEVHPPDLTTLRPQDQVRQALAGRSCTAATLARELTMPEAQALFHLRTLIAEGHLVTSPPDVFLTTNVFVTEASTTPATGSPWRGAFTLIELLVVIAIIALLIAILLPRYNDAQRKPYDVAALQCGRAIVTAETTYRLANGSYADSIGPLGKDVAEACTNVQVSNGGVTSGAVTDGNGGVAISATNYAFSVWSKSGSGWYRYNMEDGTNDNGGRLNRNNSF